MTTELTKAAQQALEAFDAFADADDFPTCFELTKKMNALRRALTASQPAPTAQELERAAEMCDGFAAPDMAAALRSQPAQAGEVDERVAFEAWLGREAFTKRSDSGKYESVHVDAMWSAWQARASMPTQPAAQATPDVPETDFGNMATQQATPEPVGEPWGWAIEDRHGVAQAIRPARKEFFGCVQSSEPFTAEDVSKMDREWAGLAPHRIVTLYTRPAPGVPEAWDEGYRQGVQDERTSEANIGIAGFGAKVSPARQNPYRAAAQAKGDAHE